MGRMSYSLCKNMAYPWEPRARIRIDIQIRGEAADWRRPKALNYSACLVPYLKLSNQRIDQFYRLQPNRDGIDLNAFGLLCEGRPGEHRIFKGYPEWEDGDNVRVRAAYEEPRFIRWESQDLTVLGPDGEEAVPEVIYFPRRDIENSAETLISELRELSSIFGERFTCSELDVFNNTAAQQDAAHKSDPRAW